MQIMIKVTQDAENLFWAFDYNCVANGTTDFITSGFRTPDEAIDAFLDKLDRRNIVGEIIINREIWSLEKLPND
jgi:hypothetical protein